MSATHFKLIVAGGREFNDYATLSKLVAVELRELSGGKAWAIVSGMARGADSLGARYAQENGILLHKYPADWDSYGKSAGFRRNEEMAIFADALIAFWDKESRGTKHMIETMQKLGKPTRVVTY